MLSDTHTCTKRDTHLHTRGHGLLHMRTLALLWHSETHVVTAWSMPGNSFKGMLIFQMLLDINKPPNWRAEIWFERSSAWRCRDVYPSLRICVAGRLSGHLVFTFDKSFLLDYQFSCSQQRGHSGEGSSYKNLIVACLGEFCTRGRAGRDDNLCGSFCCATRLQTKSTVRCDQTHIQTVPAIVQLKQWYEKSCQGDDHVENIEHKHLFSRRCVAKACQCWRSHWCHGVNVADGRYLWATTEEPDRFTASASSCTLQTERHANGTHINMLAVACYFCKCSLKTSSSWYQHRCILGFCTT